MKKITNKQFKEIEDLHNKMQNLFEKYQNKYEELNDKISDFVNDELNPIISEFNEVVNQLQPIVDEIQERQETYIDKRSDNWSYTIAGEEYSGWHDEWRIQFTELDEVEIYHESEDIDIYEIPQQQPNND